MRWILDKAELLRAVAAASCLPLRKDQGAVLRLTPEDGAVFSCASLQRDVIIEAKVYADAQGFGAVTVPVKALAHFLSTMDCDPVILEADGLKIEVSGGGGGLEWKMDKDDFGRLEREDDLGHSFPDQGEPCISVEDEELVGWLAGAVREAMRCASNDYARPGLCGVGVAREGQHLFVSGTDGRAAVMLRRDCPHEALLEQVEQVSPYTLGRATSRALVLLLPCSPTLGLRYVRVGANMPKAFFDLGRVRLCVNLEFNFPVMRVATQGWEQRFSEGSMTVKRASLRRALAIVQAAKWEMHANEMTLHVEPEHGGFNLEGGWNDTRTKARVLVEGPLPVESKVYAASMNRALAMCGGPTLKLYLGGQEHLSVAQGKRDDLTFFFVNAR